ncbi:hypothetical protein WM40_22720 [Robbsia andropogonis]|uniref:Uncharacterized protein n=1 Tax=Robbsia andropogonis TaxID=28092 RepID=A0A0F5JVA8_9BURK|nr:hypothetical protein WM40_22720 [Robbsia andropogonis]
MNKLADEAKVDVLIERMNAYMDDQKEMKGQILQMMQMQLTLASISEQLSQIKDQNSRLFKKSDLAQDRIIALEQEVAGNKKAWRTIMILAPAIPVLITAIGLKWQPWMDAVNAAKSARDEQLQKYSQDVGAELRRDDNRITVLEFRMNNLDGNKSK